MSGPISSGELNILMGVIELAKRCGVRPADADAYIDYDPDREDGKDCQIHFVWGDGYDPGLQRFQELLGLALGQEVIHADTLEEVEDRIEQALALAPRARKR
jgi:hypothetical protein